MFQKYSYSCVKKEGKNTLDKLFVCLFRFSGTTNFVGYLTLNPFYTNMQFYFKQISLAWVFSLIVNISIPSYSVYSNNSNSVNSVKYKYSFVYTQLNIKTVLYYTIQFSVNTFSISKTVPFQRIQFSVSTKPLKKRLHKYIYMNAMS